MTISKYVNLSLLLIGLGLCACAVILNASTGVIEVIFEKNEKEKTFGQFKKSMLKAGEALSKRFCQQAVLAVVKDGAKEEQWELTPK